MGQIVHLEKKDNRTTLQLLPIWESAVRATHAFLSEADIESIRPDVEEAIDSITHLICYKEEDIVKGFIGVAEEKIEMLFVDAAAHGQGIGKKLLEYAVLELNSNYVDVNEQNPQGTGFYQYMGFQIIGRSEMDDAGRPFPILHLKRKQL